MNQLPEQIKLTFLFAILILLLFVIFIVLIVMAYKRRQIIFQKERLLRDVEYKNQILENQLEIQKQIQEERERISHDMHDDLGAGISAIKLQAEFLKQKIDDQNLKADIDDLLKTSEEMNLSMREMLWSLNSENDILGNFMQYVLIYAENFFKKANISIHIKREVDFPEIKIKSEVRRNLFLCAKEAFNNIYKHSNANNIFVHFSLSENKFTMEIIDDGVGLQSKNNAGNGLHNMKKRMNDLCGDFKILPTDKGVHLFFQKKLD